MAKKPNAAAKAAANKETPDVTKTLVSLAALVAATRSATGFMFASNEAVAPLVAAEQAEINPNVVNPDNAEEFGARATAKGMADHDGSATNDTATAGNSTGAAETNGAGGAAAGSTQAAKPTFLRQKIAMPVFARQSGGGQSVYPFDELAAPAKNAEGADEVDSFFVEATEKKPKPWESLQSAVSAATRRYATETGKNSFTKADGTPGTRAVYDYTRKFRLSEGEANGKKGAWVSRIA